jgi:hypothetical protein
MKKAVLFFAILAVLLPAVSFAALPKLSGPFLTCSGAPAPGSTLKRCTSICDIMATGQNILDFGISLLLFVIAPLFFVYGGILILISGGNPGLHSKGVGVVRMNITAILIVMAAYLIVNTFITALNLKQGEGFIQGFNKPIECKIPDKIQSP